MSEDQVSTEYNKIIYDPIHKNIQLSKLQLQFIDTPQFQRLRHLKQLGSSVFVFPGATHSRFEHSIGVSHLAETMLDQLRSRQHSELDISRFERDCVVLAGLCHDLGHGPFSHVFDSEFIPRARPGLNWSHEQGSEMLLEELVDQNGVDLSRSHLRLIRDLIHGQSSSSSFNDSSNRENKFLFDIVANKRNSIDVDKFDYIQRDCRYVGLESSYDATRLMLFSRVIGDEICFPNKEIYNVYEMFHTRFSLFKRIYTHRVSKAIEYMIVDALLEADKVLHISDAIEDPVAYTNLTDDILTEIEHSHNEELQSARDIITRLRRRHLYKFVDEYTVKPSDNLRREQVSASILLSYQQSGDNILENDIIIQWLTMDYGKKAADPVQSVKFYSKWQPNESFHIPRTQVSTVFPEIFHEVTLRIFSRNPDKVPAIQKAFRAWLGKQLGRAGAEAASIFTELPSADKWMEIGAVRNWSPAKPNIHQRGRGILFGNGGSSSPTRTLSPFKRFRQAADDNVDTLSSPTTSSSVHSSPHHSKLSEFEDI